jgi:hypothetical protein
MPNQVNGLILLDFSGTFNTIKILPIDKRQEVADCLIKLKQNNYLIAFFSTDDEKTLRSFVADYPEFANIFDAYKPESYKDTPSKPKFYQVDAYCEQFKAQGIARENIQILDDDPTSLYIIKIRMNHKVQTHQVNGELLPVLKEVEAKTLVVPKFKISSPEGATVATLASPAALKTPKRIGSPFLEKQSPLSLFSTPLSQLSSVYCTPRECFSGEIKAVPAAAAAAAGPASPAMRVALQDGHPFSMILNVGRVIDEEVAQSTSQHDEGASAMRFSGG